MSKFPTTPVQAPDKNEEEALGREMEWPPIINVSGIRMILPSNNSAILTFANNSTAINLPLATSGYAGSYAGPFMPLSSITAKPIPTLADPHPTERPRRIDLDA